MRPLLTDFANHGNGLGDRAGENAGCFGRPIVDDVRVPPGVIAGRRDRTGR
jgi:hypothetical protein